MADDKEPKGPILQTEVAGETSHSLDIGNAGQEDRIGKVKPGEDGMEMTFQRGEDGKAKPVTEEGKEPKDGTEPKTPEDADAKAPEETPPAGDADTSEPLPDFNPEDPEVTAKYDERYFTEKGLNQDTLGQEVYANSQKEGGKPVLNEGTYKYLEAKLGVTRDMADAHIAGQIALKQQNDATFYGMVGGEEAWKAQLAWGSANYTPEQKARFRKAMDAGGEEAKEAAELLGTRFTKAGGKVPLPAETPAPVRAGFGRPERRAASPAKTTATAAGGGAGGTPAEPYADQKEYNAALKAAGRDPAAQAKVRKRLAASPWMKAPVKG